MKILSTEQLREADAYTIAHEPVASVDLMERAAQACQVWLFKKFRRSFVLQFFCGNGNNGGDGLAIARLLADHDVHCEMFVYRVAQNDSPDFSANLARLQKQGKVAISFLAENGEEYFPPANGKIIVDAIFGSGLTREPSETASRLIDHINKQETTVISIDLPSGLFGDDNSSNSRKHVVHAAHTLTFQQPKLAFFFPENGKFTGKFHVFDIGLHPDFIASAKSHFHYTRHTEAKQLYKPRDLFSHKGSFGHALIVAGGTGKMGAAVLATQACLRAGAGLVTAATTATGNSILQTAVPEAMVQIIEGENFIAGKINFDQITAIGIGPGIGKEEETAHALKLLINEYAGPLVLDADALNIIAENKTWLGFLPFGTILTPHPGEFDRLTEKHNSGYDRMETQRNLATKLGAYIILKGAYSSIACPDGTVYFNASGNPGMATGGSGDVLAGIITGLLAQGYLPLAACKLGVYLHGLAGDIAASLHNEEGLIAGDITDQLGGAWRMVAE